MIKVLSLSIIIIVWLVYYINFGLAGNISSKTEVWGQFGDYVGGVVNPILSFITIYLLIQSLSFQRQANATLIDEVKRQEALENYKKFEIRFFSLIEAQDTNFNKFSIVCSTDVDSDNDNMFSNSGYNKLKSGEAVNFIDDALSVLVKAKVKDEAILEWLSGLDEHDEFFSISRRFYLIVKLIDDKVESKFRDEQYETLLNLTDVKLLVLLAILCNYYEWDSVRYIKASGILDKDGLINYVEHYK